MDRWRHRHVLATVPPGGLTVNSPRVRRWAPTAGSVRRPARRRLRDGRMAGWASTEAQRCSVPRHGLGLREDVGGRRCIGCREARRAVVGVDVGPCTGMDVATPGLRPSRALCGTAFAGEGAVRAHQSGRIEVVDGYGKLTGARTPCRSATTPAGAHIVLGTGSAVCVRPARRKSASVLGSYRRDCFGRSCTGIAVARAEPLTCVSRGTPRPHSCGGDRVGLGTTVAGAVTESGRTSTAEAVLFWTSGQGGESLTLAQVPGPDSAERQRGEV